MDENNKENPDFTIRSFGDVIKFNDDEDDLEAFETLFKGMLNLMSNIRQKDTKTKITSFVTTYKMLPERSLGWQVVIKEDKSE